MKIFLRASVLALSGDDGRMSWYDLPSSGGVETVKARVVESHVATGACECAFDRDGPRQETAVMSAQVVGRIQQVLVHEGDSVRAGQTLVVLDDAALRTSVEQAQAGVKAAQERKLPRRPMRCW